MVIVGIANCDTNLSKGSLQENVENVESIKDNAFAEYLLGFKMKRREQVKSVNIWANNKNNGKLVELGLAAIFQSFETSRKLLKSANVEEFNISNFKSANQKLKNEMSSIFENVGLFSDLSRRLPRLVKNIWQKTSEINRKNLVWAIERTKDSAIYDFDINTRKDEEASLISLPIYYLENELKLGDNIDPSFVNKYDEMPKLLNSETDSELRERHRENKKEAKNIIKIAQKAQRKNMLPPKVEL